MNKQTELQAIATEKALGEVIYRPIAGGRYPLGGWYVLNPVKPFWLGFNAQQAKKKLVAHPSRADATPLSAS